MCSNRSGSSGRSSIEIGSILVTSGSSAPVDNLYLQWMNSAISARLFNEKFSASGRECAISKCRLAVGQREKGKVNMLVLVDIIDSESNRDKKQRSLTDALDPVILWIETALATLIENASIGEQEAESPALLEISYYPNGNEPTAEAVKESDL